MRVTRGLVCSGVKYGADSEADAHLGRSVSGLRLVSVVDDW